LVFFSTLLLSHFKQPWPFETLNLIVVVFFCQMKLYESNIYYYLSTKRHRSVMPPPTVAAAGLRGGISSRT
jgi:hypothetical protein